MKTGIHPEYTPARITCACGRVTETFATVEELHVEICSHCHPFYTGRQKLIDTAGRVERFRRKYGDSKGAAEPKAASSEGDEAEKADGADEADEAETAAVATGDGDASAGSEEPQD